MPQTETGLHDFQDEQDFFLLILKIL